MAKPESKRSLCRGCTEDYYNQTEPNGCWLLGDAQVVIRSGVGTFQEPPYSWNPQKTLSCNRPEGLHWLEKSDCRMKHNWRKTA